ncbi:MAG: HAD hydrolase-like protein [Spirochaetes bacterium]|nr:HAD hydrolase-like protein [Spirochaetota bacterium]
MDGTLLKTNGAGKQAMVKAAIEVYGTAGHMDTVNFQGRTDPLILMQSLMPYGISQETIFAHIENFKYRYFRYLEEIMPQSDAILLPGIRELLQALTHYDTIIIGLLTGNFYQGALIKLQYFDIFHYFTMGVFADDTHIRNDMPSIALQRLHSLTGRNFAPEDLIIIGDTIYDIECGKTAGAVTVAVATGWTDAKTLLSHKPDYFFNDLSNTNSFFDTIKELSDSIKLTVE